MSGKPTVATVPPSFTERLAAMATAQTARRFQQRQIIRRIHLHHRGVNHACAREQTHLRRTLDDVIIGNQITVVRDEKAGGGSDGRISSNR